MARTLMVVYDLGSGVVLRLVEGGSISKRRQLGRLVPGAAVSELGFYYEESGAPIDQVNDRVRRLVWGCAPVLCDAEGKPKLFNHLIEKRAAMIGKVDRLRIDFEGGMGDQVMQFEAVKALKRMRPELRIEVGMRGNYAGISRHLDSSGCAVRAGGLGPWSGVGGYVSMATEYISDPRGGLYGKASLYGAWVGVESVHEFVKFDMDAAARLTWAGKGGVDVESVRRPLLGIHIRSGSGGAKSWNHEGAEEVARRWHRETGGGVYLCGLASDYGMVESWVVRLRDGADWASVGALILSLDLLVGIDSGPMHLARAGGIPLVTLWGGTGPGDILGRECGASDVRASLPCIDNICYSCPFGHSLCMRAIKGGDVWAAILRNYGDLVGGGTADRLAAVPGTAVDGALGAGCTV